MVIVQYCPVLKRFLCSKCAGGFVRQEIFNMEFYLSNDGFQKLQQSVFLKSYSLHDVCADIKICSEIEMIKRQISELNDVIVCCKQLRQLMNRS